MSCSVTKSLMLFRTGKIKCGGVPRSEAQCSQHRLLCEPHKRRVSRNWPKEKLLLSLGRQAKSTPNLAVHGPDRSQQSCRATPQHVSETKSLKIRRHLLFFPVYRSEYLFQWRRLPLTRAGTTSKTVSVVHFWLISHSRGLRGSRSTVSAS